MSLDPDFFCLIQVGHSCPDKWGHDRDKERGCSNIDGALDGSSIRQAGTVSWDMVYLQRRNVNLAGTEVCAGWQKLCSHPHTLLANYPFNANHAFPQPPTHP